ncbi:polysaccharide lyase family 7 protein [Streptomyces montanus]|uniref:Polysaccharide lyase family 7 protein n=1 Tax=Streptomyces montanus TaxID=2580423 RepID=A0A5R9FLV1_9ACTN|nr:polysaccharide lyase family 7 protein [Streptomyces montanus]TLS41514.1 polysaccharide lyase family 7 protein [Streptomyces montanus]
MNPTRRTVLAAGGLLAGGAAWAMSPSTSSAAPASPTDGWKKTTFTYGMQKPWNLDLSDRYSNSGGVHRMWVYSTDEPMSQSSSTDPRTEMRWKQEYTSGRHMWDADVYIPSGTDGATFVQILRVIHPEGTPATDFMLNAYKASGGSVRAYDRTVLKTNAYDSWFNVKLAHNASDRSVNVYFDDELVLTTQDRGPATRHFKNGVYHHGSGRAEARFRNLTYWTR